MKKAKKMPDFIFFTSSDAGHYCSRNREPELIFDLQSSIFNLQASTELADVMDPKVKSFRYRLLKIEDSSLKKAIEISSKNKSSILKSEY